MEKLTYEQLIESLKSHFGDSESGVEKFAYEGQYEEKFNVKLLAEYGGEDQGSTWYVVYHFIDHDIYIRVDGWYQSHYGTDFEDWDSAVKQVTPKEKTITVYE